MTAAGRFEGRIVGIVGAGTMGAGIAQVFATSGFGVTMVDVDPAALAGARSRIAEGLDRLARKGALTSPDRDAALARLTTSEALEAVADAELIVEAVVERLETKLALFAEVDRLASANAILASNTSSIAIGSLAAATHRRERVLGMHFMNPAPLMPLVELVRGRETSPETMRVAADLCRAIGKTAVESADSPGFIANRVLMPMLNEAFYAVMEGVGTPEAVDTVMKLGMNHPMGPLALADLIGLDVCLDILEVLQAGHDKRKFLPCPLLRQMVAEGRLGRKTGRGFYVYT